MIEELPVREKAYSIGEIHKFEKICDLYTNRTVFEYAELYRDDKGQIVYYREWTPSHGIGDFYADCIVKSVDELRKILHSDAESGLITAAEADSLCDELSSVF